MGFETQNLIGRLLHCGVIYGQLLKTKSGIPDEFVGEFRNLIDLPQTF